MRNAGYAYHQARTWNNAYIDFAKAGFTPTDAQKLELAKNQGRIGLSLRNPLDRSQAESTGPLTAEALDPPHSRLYHGAYSREFALWITTIRIIRGRPCRLRP